MGKPYSGKPDSPFIGLQWIRRFRAYRRQPFHNRAPSSRIRLDANAIIDG
jgi:hypothetical protein